MADNSTVVRETESDQQIGRAQIMRVVLCICSVIAFGSLLLSQEPAPSAKLSIGTPKASVDAAFGKRFGPFKVEADDSNANVGVPTGTWDVYHLTAPPDRMYVTVVHYNARTAGQQVDSLMLMPAGATTVLQILRDEPAFASVCRSSCEMVLVTNQTGNRSLLLRPKNSHSETVLYFDGDSAGKWKSVTSMDSVVSWAYALSKSAFEAHHEAANDRVIGSWSTEAAAAK
jgi:hypothetical protein